MKEETKASYDKEAYIKKKREQLDNAYKTIDEGLEEITTNPNFFKEYLTVQGKFDLYTPRNAILITKQLPNAIQLKEMKKWIEDNQMQSCIDIAPFTSNLPAEVKSKYPKKIVILDPREPYTTKDGRTIKGYTAKELVDISETNMKPYTKTYDKKMILQALLHECPMDVKSVDSLENDLSSKWDTENKVLYLCRNEDSNIAFKTAITELAKINIYDNTKEVDNEKAECVAYMLCKKYGFDIEFDNIEKITERFKDMEKKDVVNELTSMKESVKELNKQISDYVQENIKQKNKEQER